MNWLKRSKPVRKTEGSLNKGFVLVLSLLLLLSGCGYFEQARRGGAYFEDDGPPSDKGPDPSTVLNAVPIVEPLSKTGNKPYTVFDVQYHPMKSAAGYREKGTASWYGKKFHGRRTSSGEVYDMYAMTAAHKTLPLPTYVKVRNLGNGAEIVVRVNDRGPFLGGRLIDLSYMAARKLDIAAAGTGQVEVMTVTPRRASVPVQEIEVSGKLGGAVFLQAGSFRLRGNAEALRHHLADKGITGITLSETWVGDTLYYRVRVGPLSRGKAVDQGLERIRTITGVQPRIVDGGY